MSSTIIVGESLPEVKVNIVPFSVQYNGPAETEKFFSTSKSTEKVGEKDIETAQFRGLKLAGEQIDLEGKTGYVLTCSEFMTQDPLESEPKMVKQYSGVAKFETLNVYGHDHTAPLNSKWKLLGEWNKIADVIHS